MWYTQSEMKFSAIQLSELGAVAYRIVVLTILSAIIGVLVSICTIGFVESVFFLNDLLLVSSKIRFQYGDSPVLLSAATVLVPALGGLIVGLLFKFWSESRRNLGPADSIHAVQFRTVPATAKDGLISTLASIVSLGVGASVGQYGPIVYLGTIIGSFIDRMKLDIPEIRSIGISAGIAAAIATAFNAPLAGMIFAHEVVLRHYAIRAFAPTALAAAIGYVIASVIFERPPLFTVHFDGVEHQHEYLLFALIGVMAAFVATLFVRLLTAVSSFARRSPIPFALRPMAAGFLLGLVALQLPEILGVGRETLRFATIDGAFQSSELALILVAKFGLTIICLGFGFAGGTFSPVLLIGIVFGALFGSILGDIDIIAHSGVVPYAISGMMAVTSAVIGAPLTTILIVLELTRNYDLVIAAMVAVVFSNLISHRLFGRSLYDLQLGARGYDLSSGRLSAILSISRITELMHDNFISIHQDDTVEDALARLRSAGFPTGVVVKDDNMYVGVVHVRNCTEADPSQTVESVTQRDVLAFDDTLSIRWAMEWMTDFVGVFVPIISVDDGRLLGVVSEGNIIDAYLNDSERLRREENDSI